MFGFGCPCMLGLCPSDLALHMTPSIISNKEINNIMKIVKFLEESGLLTKGISKAVKNEAKEHKEAFLRMLLGILGASLVGNILAGKGVLRAGEATIRGGQNF